jgi:hypothetical protein
MFSMKQHGIIAAIVIFALVIVGMFIFAFLKKSELAELPTPQPAPAPVVTPYDSITRIDAKHFFIDGTHTIVGEILMPTACDLLNWESVVRESMPEGVTVAFTVLNNSTDCEPKTTPQRFLVTFEASSEARIDATLNGRAVELNLIPAAEGETPEDFELFIKG